MAPFSEWGATFSDPPLAVAVVDRLIFRAHIIETGTQSYRLRAAGANKSSRPPEEPGAIAMTQPAPLVDDDTYELIDDAIAELGDRRDLFFDDASNIHLLASLIAQAERCLPLAVAEARGMERPWVEIAELLGTTEDAARARFDPASPTCDRRWPFDAD